MSKLLPVTLFAIFMAVLSHMNSHYDPIECRYYRKDRLFYTILTIALILFSGLRIYYNDTTAYVLTYEQLGVNADWHENVYWDKIGENPAFFFVQGILKDMNASSQTFLMVFSCIYVGINLWFFRKYSCNLWLSVVLYITFAGYIFSLAAIKQCTAMAICLVATDRAINKKYVRFVLYVLLASLFHPYALMYLIVPFLFFRPWSKNTLIMLALFGLIGVGMESLIGTVLNVTDMLGEHYDAASFMGEGINPMRLIVTAVPTFLSLLVASQIGEDEEREQYLIVNLTMLNAEIMFVALFGTANYFGRLANYFIPFQAVSVPWLLKHYDARGRRTLTLLAVIGYALFFIYSNAIQSSFDAGFYRITLAEYFKDLFGEGIFNVQSSVFYP